MNRRPLVLMDVDGVLADFVAASLTEIQRRFGIEYRAEQVTAWDFSSLPGWDGIKDRFWSEIARGIGFCASIPVVEESQEGIDRLRKIADVEFLTSPMHGAPTWVHERDQWLEKNFEAHHRDVMHVRKKQRVVGDVLVDDNQQNLESWQQHHPQGLALLWDQPYNRDLPADSSIMRVSNWEEVLYWVKLQTFRMQA